MTPASAATTAGSHPDHVGRFKITRLLGTGSMGAVYLADDPVIHREVAIKTLNVNLSTSEARVFEETFLNEARAAGRLNHPHIVTVYDAGRIDGQSYIAMEYLKGVELKDLIARGEKFTIKQAVEIFVRVADALQYAHENGIVHRDVKPANIFMTGTTNPKVLDFGIAQAVTSFSGSFVGTPFAENIVGTPNYLSPESIRGRPLDGRSDLFSLGVVMYEVLTREVPFRGTTFEELTKNIVEKHPRPPQNVNPDVPLEIARVVGKALAKEPADRYQSAKDIASDLRRWAAGQRVKQIISANAKAEDTEAPLEARPEAKSVRHPVFWVACAVVVVTAFTVGTLWDKFHARTVRPVAPAFAAPAPAPVVPAAPPVVEAPAPVPTAEINPPEPAPAQRAKTAKRLIRPADKPVAPVAIEHGTLMIAVSPWGEVVVDGVSRGLSPPLSTLALPAGRHAIEVRNGDAPPQTSSVEIKPDETARVRFKF